MQIPKPSDDDKAYFRSLVPDDPRIEIKPMFGNLGAFVNGNMFMGLFGSDVGVKLPAAEREQLVAAGRGAFGPAERPMQGYVTLPRTGEEEGRNPEWAAAALAHVAELPPKTTAGGSTARASRVRKGHR